MAARVTVMVFRGILPKVPSFANQFAQAFGSGTQKGVEQGASFAQKMALQKLKNNPQEQLVESLLGRGEQPEGNIERGGRSAFQPLSQQQKAVLALTDPKAFNAYQQLEQGYQQEEEKAQGQEQLSETLTNLADTLLQGNLGKFSPSWLTPQGRRDRQYFDVTALKLESIAKDMVSKGVLARDRFNYLLKNLPSSTNTDAANAGALEAWADELGVPRPQGLEVLYKAKGGKTRKKKVTPKESTPDIEEFTSPEPEEATEGLSFPKLGFGKKTVPGDLEEMKRQALRDLKVVGSTVAGLPGDIGAQVGKGLNWIKKELPFGTPKSEEEMEEIIHNPLTSESIREKIEEFSPELAPRNEAERNWEENLSLLTSLLTPIPGGGKTKFVSKAAKDSLYQAGKALGMTEKELAPLFNSQLSQKTLGKLARLGDTAAERVKLSQDALGNIYDIAKNAPGAGELIPGKASEKLGEGIFKFIEQMRDTLAQSPDTKAVIDFAENSYNKLMNHGTTPKTLINFYKEINKATNWNAVRNGKKSLAHLKGLITKTLKETNPQAAKDFEIANKLWAKSEDILARVKPTEYNQLLKTGGLVSLGVGLLTFNPLALKAAGLGLAGKYALQKLSTELLTNPKYQELLSKMTHALEKGNVKGMQALMQTLKIRSEDFLPEEEHEALFGPH